MTPIAKKLLEKALKKIQSIMQEQSIRKITLHRQYLPEILDAELLEIYEGLPILKPAVEKYFRLKGMVTKFTDREIIFKEGLANLDDELKGLLASNPEVRAAALVTTEGLPIALVLPQGVDESRMAAMIAVLYSIAGKLAKEMKNGQFDQLYIKGNGGYILLIRAGPNSILAVSTTKDVRLRQIFSDNEYLNEGD